MWQRMCTKCSTTKPLDKEHFYVVKGAFTSRCKECIKAYGRNYYKNKNKNTMDVQPQAGKNTFWIPKEEVYDPNEVVPLGPPPMSRTREDIDLSVLMEDPDDPFE